LTRIIHVRVNPASHHAVLAVSSPLTLARFS
jgi:hypothetical protein